MFEISWIRNKIEKTEYFFTIHGEQERQNDNLSIAEVEEAFFNGIILEQYENDKRGESCLVAGFANSGKPVHIVCGKFDGDLAIITVYVPAPPKFKNLYERG